MNRTHYLNELTINNEGEIVNLFGWVKNQRNFGEIVFIDLGDMYGITQVVVENNDMNLNKIAQELRNEDCINVSGIVRKRQDINNKIETGEIEVVVDVIKIINKSEVLPIDITDNSESNEDARFKYRYLDIRRHEIISNLKFRHKIGNSLRFFLNEHSFLEIETPILTKSTPEGARDYLVPSRVNEEKFYALPQSPQIYKNLLMNGSIDKYYQFAKCFRDEDLRSDRQPEFTQLDMEMAFMDEFEIQNLVEKMIKQMMKDTLDITFNEDFIKMPYDKAMELYGVDKPDIRFEMFINDVTNVFNNSEFKVFANAEYVRVIKVSDAADKYSRKDISKLEELAKKHGAKGMPWLKYSEGTLSGSITKVISDDEKNELIDKLSVEDNDLLIFASDTYKVTSAILGNLRNHFGKELKLYNENEFKYLWIIDWPLFEYDSEDMRYYAVHHPFTMPKDGVFIDDLEKQQAVAYDLVLNGHEIGGGSIRINNPELQHKMFKLLSFSDEEIEEQFGFLKTAYSFGAPYHGGFALGYDRLVMVLTNSQSIKEVIAFPKNNRAVELVMDSPSNVSSEQLNELNIKIDKGDL